MNIVVNEELKAYIDPLTPEEHEALERSLLAEGCRDALVLWASAASTACPFKRCKTRASNPSKTCTCG
jgi:hypothetical protein